MSRPRANQLSSASASFASESKETTTLSREVEAEQIYTAADCLHQDLMPIIFNYLDNNVGGVPHHYVRKHTLFGNLSTLYHSQAKLAAYHILSGDPEEVKRLVNRNPLILYCSIEIKDHQGRRVKGTPLQIAAMAGDFNIRNKKGSGMVERLRCYLSKEEAIKQLLAKFPPGWEKETEERMKPYLTALNKFIKEIVKAKADTYLELEAKCESSIKKFRHSLIPNPNQVITSGYIFDPQILCTAMELVEPFEKNTVLSGGWCSNKSAFFWVYGIGSLQACASVCDIQIFKEGIYNVINESTLPNRLLNFSDEIPSALFSLGSSCFLNIFGNFQSLSGGMWAQKNKVCWKSSLFYKSLTREKTTSLQRIMQQPDNNEQSSFILFKVN